MTNKIFAQFINLFAHSPISLQLYLQVFFWSFLLFLFIILLY